MRIFAYFALTLMLCTALPVTAFADEITDPLPEETPSESIEVTTEETGKDIVVNVNLPPETISNPVEDPAAIEEEDPGVSSTYAVSVLDETEDVSVSDPEQQTMKDVVSLVLGDYAPRTQTVTQYFSDGSSETYTEIVPGVAGMDWEWLSGAGLFGLLLFSFLKLVGVLLKNG